MQRRHTLVRLATLAVAAMLLAGIVAACGGDDDTTGSSGSSDACGLDALQAEKKPVDVTFWHTMVRANNTWLRATVAKFNASQSDVRVRLIQQPTYQDVFTKYTAGLRTGDLPDLVQLEETT